MLNAARLFSLVVVLVHLAASVDALADYGSGSCQASMKPPYPIVEREIDAEKISAINGLFPEGKKLTNSDHPLYDLNPTSGTTSPNILFKCKANLTVTFIHEGAGYRNQFGIFTFNTTNGDSVISEEIVFPNLSFHGSGGCHHTGDSITLGPFEAGTNLGFFINANGFQRDTFYSYYSFLDNTRNPDNQRHVVTIYDEGWKNFYVGFEDLYNLGDVDYNDAMFFYETSACESEPVDCVVSDYTAWTTCSAQCGGGEQTRSRSILTPAAYGGAACPALSESRVCNEEACSVDCEVNDWGAWGDCNAACGGGERTRSRTVKVAPVGSGAPCPALTETNECGTDACSAGEPDVDCEVSEWSEWSDCTAPCNSAETGTQTRVRTVEQVASGSGTCGALSETRSCASPACTPVNCVVSSWGSWSACSATCDGGVKVRTRAVLVSPQYGGEPCPAQMQESEECNTNRCADESAVDTSDMITVSGGQITECRAAPAPSEEGDKILSKLGEQYAVLDGTPYGLADSGCQTNMLSLPPGLWDLTEPSPKHKAAMRCYYWGTSCLAFKDGSSYNTRDLDSCPDAIDMATQVDGTTCYSPNRCSYRTQIHKKEWGPYIPAPLQFNYGWTADDAETHELVSGKWPDGAAMKLNGGGSAFTTIEGDDVPIGAYGGFSIQVKSMSELSQLAISGDYSLVVDIEYPGNAGNQFGAGVIQFETGAHGWHEARADIFPTRSLKGAKIYVHLINRHQNQGAVYFADLKIDRPNGNALKQGDFNNIDWYSPTGNASPLPGWQPMEAGLESEMNIVDGNPTDKPWLYLSQSEQNKALMIKGTGDLEGAKHDVYTTTFFEEGVSELYVGGWTKAVNATGSRDATYSIYVDMYYVSGEKKLGVHIPLPLTDEWTYHDKLIPMTAGEVLSAAVIYLRAGASKAGGSFYFDDIEVRGIECGSGSESLAYVVGDPHYKTLDGLAFDVQTVGEHLLYEDDNDVSVQVRHASAGSAAVASAFVISYKDSAFQVTRGQGTNPPTVHINGAKIRYNEQTSTTIRPSYDANKVTSPIFDATVYFKNMDAQGKKGLQFPFQAVFHVPIAGEASPYKLVVQCFKAPGGDQYLELSVDSLPDNVRGKTRGLFGNWDGDKDNDLVSADGTVFDADSSKTSSTFYSDFVTGHDVKAETARFRYYKGESTETFKDATFSDVFIQKQGQVTPEEREAAAKVCAGTGVMSKDCESDVIMSGNPGIAAGYRQSGKAAASEPLVTPAGLADKHSSGQNDTSLVRNIGLGALALVATVAVIAVVVIRRRRRSGKIIGDLKSVNPKNDTQPEDDVDVSTPLTDRAANQSSSAAATSLPQLMSKSARSDNIV